MDNLAVPAIPPAVTIADLDRAAVAPEPKRANIAERTVCLSLTIRSIGNSRKVSSSQVEVDADKDLIRVSKQLLDSEELKAIKALDSEMRQYLYRMALPSLFRAGVYMLPVEIVEMVDDSLQKFQQDRSALIDKLIEAYPALVRTAEERLRSTFAATDYPTAEAVRDSFSISWQYVAFDTPDKLKAISGALFRREREKAERQWVDATEEIRRVLRAQFASLVGHMSEKLKPGEDGKKRVFRDSMVSKLAEFLETVKFRNVTDDDELSTLVGRARDLLKGVSAKDLRDEEALRSSLQGGMDKIKSQLDQMVVEQPTRAISFEDL